VPDGGTLQYYVNRYGLEVIVSLWDAFVLPSMGKPSVPWVAYIPIDAPLTRKMANYVLNADLIVAYSHFGYEQLQKHFPEFMTKYIPHGITETFKPRTRARAQLRKEWGIPEDKFMFLFVGANMGERKCIPQLVRTFKKFLQKHSDAILYLYTNMFTPYPNGYSIMDYAEELRIQDKVMGPAFNTMLDSAEEDELAKLYACADVTINPALGEGFGMALLESMACGTPVIATDNSSMRELITGHGWPIETVPEDVWVDIPVWIPTLQEYAPPNLKSLLDCMEDAYSNPDKREEYGKASRRFTRQYTWDKIIPQWDALIKELTENAQTR
jgi:glycosyltransferase involved in cell wall biosynthesis